MRDANQADIQFAIPHRGLAGITFGSKFEHHAVAEIARQRPMGLQGDAFLRAARELKAQGTFSFAEDAVKYADLNAMFA